MVMWREPGEYPSIKIMLTDNPKYMEGRKVCRTRKEAEEAFSRWLLNKADYIK